MNLNSNIFAHRQYLLCAAFLALAYILVYGWLLASTNFLPYVMDNNESFSSYWHALNIAQFDFFKSFGLTDEAYGFSAAAHPYVYTHQGNFPRLFNLLIYTLGAHTVESQIAITTFTVGIAAIFMAYHFFYKIANPLFALVCCLLLVTDYVLVAQWQVVTYRVWHEFFVFSSMLCAHRMVEGRRFWVITTLLNFACLFYYEFIFVAFVVLSSALYAVFLCRHAPKRVLGFWALQAAGGAISLSVLALQLYLYLGWDDLKLDAYLTFVARNHYDDSAALLQRMQEFFDSRNIVFWYNLEDGSRFRTIAHFLASITYFEFQIHTPFLSTLCMVSLLALFAILIFRSLSAATDFNKLREVHGELGNTRQLIWSTPVIGTLILSYLQFFYEYYRDDFGNLQFAQSLAIVAGVLFFVVAVEFWPRFGRSSADRSRSLRKAADLLALVILTFNIPSILNRVAFVSRRLDQYSTFYFGYILIFVFFSAWVLWTLLSEERVRREFLLNISLSRIGSAAATLISFLSWLSFFVVLLGKNLIFGFQNEKQQWFVPASFEHYSMALIAAACAASFLHYICSSSTADGKPSSDANRNVFAAKLMASIFVLLGTLLIAGSWKLYNPRYALLWPEMADSSLPAPFPYVVATLVMMLTTVAVATRGKVFSGLGNTLVLKGCSAFVLTGFCAYVVVYMLSPGYIYSGYRFRLAPFTVFHTVMLLALPLYVMLAVGLKYLAPYWPRRLKAESGILGISPPPDMLPGHRGVTSKSLGIASLITLGMLSVYWIGVQLSYLKLMPPDYFSFLDKLSKPPYVGNSFVVNTYAAPIAAKTGAWAYFNASLTSEKLAKNGDRYEFSFDTTYLWFADKRINPDYARPSYFLCVTVQSTSSVMEGVHKQNGLSDGYPGCEANQLVRLARDGQGKSVYPSLELLEADEAGPKMVGFERWAIVKLNWTK